MLRRVLHILTIFVLTALPWTLHGAVGVPAGFAAKQIVTGLRSPTTMAFSPDNRLFVCEQAGRLRVIKNETLLARPFLTVGVDSTGERGLLGVAFDPDFVNNQYVYVYYTSPTPAPHNRVSRFTASGDTALAGSEQVLLDITNLGIATIHNGGALHFGPDGTLFVATGENSASSNSQNMTNLLGKMLRINPDGSIPADNPFYGSASGLNKTIWALGLRNPFTFAFQPGSGRLLINDVGQATWEEIDDGIPGSNYGWPTTEGFTANPLFRGPLKEYGHATSDSTGCAITGGDFYNPATVSFPLSYVGKYFYADYCGGWIRTFDTTDSSTTLFANGLLSPVDVHVDTGGSLYYLTRNQGGATGTVGRIRYSPGTPPVFSVEPVNVTVQPGQTATFFASASGNPPITYVWQRNDTTISLATSPTYSLPNAQLSDSGAVFRCIASNGFGSDTSHTALLRVVRNHRPVATILGPMPGMTYRGGDLISYSGTAVDSEQGTLAPQALTWQVDFHHDQHLHPFIPATSGSASGSFTIPVSGETSDSVWYRIILTATDSGGLSDTAFVDILPQKSTDTLRTTPPGLSLLLDGQGSLAPIVFTGVVGIQRTISAPMPQSVNGQSYDFASWSDGGGASHVISTPASNSSFAATFVASPAVPSPDAPPNNSTGEPLALTVSWHPSPAATRYRLQLSTDSSFASTILDDSTVTDTSRPISGLNGSTSYFWRVRGEKSGGTSAYSAISKFTTLTLVPALAIVTASPLPPGLSGVPYNNDTLIASGGALPYRWAMQSGAFPPGITLSANGVISGTPTAAGVYAAIVQVTDNVDSLASKSFALTVNNPLPATTTIAPTTKTRGDASFVISVSGTNFVSGSIVRFDGSDRPTTFVNNASLSATISSADIAAAGSHLITVFNAPPSGGTSNSQTFTVATPAISLRAFLQGPYHSGGMSLALRASGSIPLSQPYSGAPWKYFGTESVGAIPANVVDWILLEIRSGIASFTRVARRAAFIKNDGSIVDLDGTSPVTLTGVNTGSYYFVLRHRNHLPVMCSSAILVGDSTANFDFTTGLGKYYGGDAKNLGGGVFGLYSGDFSQDGFIDSDDFVGPDNDIFKSGYLRSDLNLDGFVDSDDFIPPDNNVFKSTLVPN